jgi:transposase
MGKHYSKEVKLEAVRLFEAGKTHGEITEALGIRDGQRSKKWIRAYRERGAEAFEEVARKGVRGRRPKKENTKAYIARLEMEVALLKNSIPNCGKCRSRSAISVDLPPPNGLPGESHVRILWCFASRLL